MEQRSANSVGISNPLLPPIELRHRDDRDRKFGHAHAMGGRYHTIVLWLSCGSHGIGMPCEAIPCHCCGAAYFTMFALFTEWLFGEVEERPAPAPRPRQRPRCDGRYEPGSLPDCENKYALARRAIREYHTYEHADLAGCIAPKRDLQQAHTTRRRCRMTAAPCLFFRG